MKQIMMIPEQTWIMKGGYNLLGKEIGNVGSRLERGHEQGLVSCYNCEINSHLWPHIYNFSQDFQ